MSKIGEYLASWIMYLALIVSISLSLSLFIPIDYIRYIIEFIISILIILLLSEYNELPFWKLIGFIFLSNILFGFLLLIFLGVFS